MLGAKALGDLACKVQLVIVALAKTDREGLDGRRTELGHLRNYRARVHASAQECAEAYIGNKTSSDRVPQQGPELLDGLVFAQLKLVSELHLPVRRDLDAS